MSIKVGYAHVSKTDKYTHWSFIINGKRYGEGHGYAFMCGDKLMGLTFTNEILEILEKCTFEDLLENVPDWGIDLEDLEPAISLEFNIYKEPYHHRRAGTIYEIRFDFEKWKKPWSIEEYGNAFIKEAEALNNGEYLVALSDETAVGGIELRFPLPQVSTTLGDSLSNTMPFVRRIAQQTRLNLLLSSRSDSIVSLFDFPPEHQTACKQYLAFFKDFLSGFGVQCRTEISDEAQKVLFAVTPEDKKIALLNIREALAIYLSLPEHKITEKSLDSNDDNVRKLAENIISLQNSLKPGTKYSIGPHSTETSIGGKIEEEKEEFWNGRLYVKKWSKGPIELNLPRILKELKARFPILRKLN